MPNKPFPTLGSIWKSTSHHDGYYRVVEVLEVEGSGPWARIFLRNLALESELDSKPISLSTLHASYTYLASFLVEGSLAQIPVEEIEIPEGEISSRELVSLLGQNYGLNKKMLRDDMERGKIVPLQPVTPTDRTVKTFSRAEIDRYRIEVLEPRIQENLVEILMGTKIPVHSIWRRLADGALVRIKKSNTNFVKHRPVSLSGSIKATDRKVFSTHRETFVRSYVSAFRTEQEALLHLAGANTSQISTTGAEQKENMSTTKIPTPAAQSLLTMSLVNAYFGGKYGVDGVYLSLDFRRGLLSKLPDYSTPTFSLEEVERYEKEVVAKRSPRKEYPGVSPQVFDYPHLELDILAERLTSQSVESNIRTGAVWYYTSPDDNGACPTATITNIKDGKVHYLRTATNRNDSTKVEGFLRSWNFLAPEQFEGKESPLFIVPKESKYLTIKELRSQMAEINVSSTRLDAYIAANTISPAPFTGGRVGSLIFAKSAVKRLKELIGSGAPIPAAPVSNSPLPTSTPEPQPAPAPNPQIENHPLSVANLPNPLAPTGHTPAADQARSVRIEAAASKELSSVLDTNFQRTYPTLGKPTVTLDEEQYQIMALRVEKLEGMAKSPLTLSDIRDLLAKAYVQGISDERNPVRLKVEVSIIEG